LASSLKPTPAWVAYGIDPFAGPDAAPSLSCRIYHGEHRTAGAPSVAQLSAALAT
jgi:hypothetical protein